jgi:hypothetical protein
MGSLKRKQEISSKLSEGKKSNFELASSLKSKILAFFSFERHPLKL